jgi:Acetyltransferase (GNAT) domain
VKARLIEDGGRAASDPEQFFRSPAFLEAEGATHTLAVEGEGELHLPVIVRPVDSSERRDAISPYGYPGAAELPDSPLDPTEIDWSETGLVSVFVRDRIGDRPCLAGGTLRAHVRVADGDGGIRKRLREQIRRNERRGWRVGIAPGSEADREDRAAFERAYAETMARTRAAERYLFASEYFERVLASAGSWLMTAAPGEGAEPLAGAIAAASDGYLHYYLGATADEGLEDSPMKNVFAAIIALGGELGLPVSLGGGVTPGDSLDAFKRGFANSESPWHTHEIVCDPAAYEELSAAATSPQGFFPAYRA